MRGMPKPHDDPLPVVSDVRRRHVLNFAPVDMIDDPDRRAALLAASGVDLSQRRWTRRVVALACILGVLLVARLLLGCAALPAIGAGLSTAGEVAKIGCAMLGATDGSSASVLAANHAMDRAILESQAREAVARGADQKTVDALVASIAVLSAAVRANAEQVVIAAGNGPAKLPPCPVSDGLPTKAPRP